MIRPYLLTNRRSDFTMVADFVYLHKSGGICFVTIGWDVPGRHPFHIIEGKPRLYKGGYWKCGGYTIRQLTRDDQYWFNWSEWEAYKQSPDCGHTPDEMDRMAMAACLRDGAIGDPL